MLTINRIFCLLISLIVFACSETPKSNLEKSETIFPIDTANITGILFSVFYSDKDSVVHENVSHLKKAEYLNIISNINSSIKILDPKVVLNIQIDVIYIDNKRVIISASNKYFTSDHKVFYNWADTIFIKLLKKL